MVQVANLPARCRIATGIDATGMQVMAADVGYSEMAFLVPRPAESNVYDVRFFAPQGECRFCGLKPSTQH
jgi:predicted PhzF superfamily epimerase YddE/YHI9